jgi:tRNA pseudouridine55 synthase
LNKPTATTSSDVIRTLQEKLTPSPLFKTHLDAVRAARAAEPRTKSRDRRDKRRLDLKIGHGGTLDPLATGVLITGIGGGTKALSQYLACTKTYEAVVLFGVESDSFDVLGQVTGSADWDGVNKDSVREALKGFMGKFDQIPPVFSARRINGVRLYELAREGKEVPDGALKPRPVEVTEMELLEYWGPGEHEYIMRTENREEAAQRYNPSNYQRKELKRKRRDEKASQKQERAAKATKTDKDETVVDASKPPEGDGPFMSGALPVEDNPLQTDSNPVEQASEEAPKPTPEEYKLGPAARVRMTVTSGFYVRSLCHDLGKALGSAAVMATLVRTRQGDFDLGKNVLEYDDLQKGEEVWGPKVEALLQDWQDREEEKQKSLHRESPPRESSPRQSSPRRQ